MGRGATLHPGSPSQTEGGAMSGADGITGPGRTGAPEAGPPDPGATRRGPHDRWLVALVVLAVVLLLAAVVIAWIELRGDDEPEPAGAATSTATSEPAATASGTPTEPGEVTPEPTEAAPGGESLPLPELGERYDGTGPVTSDIPASEDSLQDGAFVVILHGVDAQARTISADVVIFYGGQPAYDYLAEHDPERAAEGLENGYLIVNDVERVRELPVSPSVRVGRWCWDDVTRITQEQTFEAWATAEPDHAPTTACTEPGRQGNELYWIDVRDGVVLQITGQYVP